MNGINKETPFFLSLFTPRIMPCEYNKNGTDNRSRDFDFLTLFIACLKLSLFSFVSRTVKKNDQIELVGL